MLMNVLNSVLLSPFAFPCWHSVLKSWKCSEFKCYVNTVISAFPLVRQLTRSNV